MSFNFLGEKPDIIYNKFKKYHPPGRIAVDNEGFIWSPVWNSREVNIYLIEINCF